MLFQLAFCITFFFEIFSSSFSMDEISFFPDFFSLSRVSSKLDLLLSSSSNGFLKSDSSLLFLASATFSSFVPPSFSFDLSSPSSSIFSLTTSSKVFEDLSSFCSEFVFDSSVPSFDFWFRTSSLRKSSSSWFSFVSFFLNKNS